jgi:hypothetical protein
MDQKRYDLEYAKPENQGGQPQFWSKQADWIAGWTIAGFLFLLAGRIIFSELKG